LAASYRSYEGLADGLKTGIVVKLPKLRTKKEDSTFGGTEVGIDVPYNRIPLLIKEVNLHRKNIAW